MALHLAGGAAFMAALRSLAGSPWVTIGLPTAVSAVSALNDSQGGPSENLASAGGAALGGAGLGAAGAIGGALMTPGRRRLGAAIGGFGGAALGGWGGGSLARTGAELLSGNWNDPSSKAIRDAERMERSRMALEAERAQVMLPAMRAEMQLAAEVEARRAAQAAQLRTIAGYQDALFGAARSPAPPGDPNWAGLLATMGAGALS